MRVSDYNPTRYRDVDGVGGGHSVRRPPTSHPPRSQTPVTLVDTCPVVLEVRRELAEPLEDLQEHEPALLGHMLEMMVLRREVFGVLASSKIVAARTEAA